MEVNDGKSVWRRRNLTEKPLRVWQAEDALDLWQALVTGQFGKTNQNINSWISKTIKMENRSLQCISTPAGISPSSMRCLDEKNRLAYAEADGMQFRYSDFKEFEGTQYPGHFVVSAQTGEVVRANVEVGPLTSLADTFAIPLDAPASELSAPCVPGPSGISTAIATGHLVRKVAPEYPASARRFGISGTVLLHALIGKDGSVQNLMPLSSPNNDFTTAAMDAVKQWKYDPYLLCGNPVEVDTVITVNFNTRG